MENLVVEEPKMFISKAEGDKNYAKAIASLKLKINSIEQNYLEARWEIGKLFIQLHDKTGFYGSHTIEDLAHDLEFKPSTIYLFSQFYKCYREKEKIQSLKENNVNWSSIVLLCNVQDNSERNRIEEGVIMDAFTLKQLKEEVKVSNEKIRSEKPNEVERRGGTSPISILKNIEHLAEDFLKRLSEGQNYAGDIHGLDEPRKEKVKLQLAKVFKALEALTVGIDYFNKAGWDAGESDYETQSKIENNQVEDKK